MITDIPTAEDFQAAGLNQIFLAWKIIIQTIIDFEEVTGSTPEYDGHDVDAASANFWQKSQPVLANALGLIQQAMEMGLKSRISAISPYLLIARDPKDWPSRVESEQVPFSEFRTLDAADLVKVHNAFSSQPFNSEFKRFWETVRRDRNRLMHSVSSQSFKAEALIQLALVAIHELFGDMKWPARLLEMEADDKYAAYGFGGEFDQNSVMHQIDTVMKLLSPSDRLRFFGFKKRRAYLCPSCWQRANRDFQEDWPRLAQLSTPSPECTTLQCVICEDVPEIERIPCNAHDCKGNVIFDDRCMTCLAKQDQPSNFRSGLEASGQHGNSYSFLYHSEFDHAYADGRFSDDGTAIEHARRSMDASYLASWRSVAVLPPGHVGLDPKARGSWVRRKKDLVWKQGYKVPLFPHRRRRRRNRDD